MKLQFKSKFLLAACAFIIHNFATAQSITLGPGNCLQVENLPTLDPPAEYSFLWWYDDNYYSFEDTSCYTPKTGSNPDCKTLAIVSENYGSSGDPDIVSLSDEIPGTYEPHYLLNYDETLSVVRYRNAVRGDLLFLIVEYGNSLDPIQSGSIKVSTDADCEVDLEYMDLPEHETFLPNDEVRISDFPATWDFQTLDSSEQRCVLIPIRVFESAEEFINITIELTTTKLVGEGTRPRQVVQSEELQLPILRSHDPNVITEQSVISNNCLFDRGQIDYRIDFENVGDTSTEYVKVTCYLDRDLDIDQISNIQFPQRFKNVYKTGDLHGYTRRAMDTCIFQVDTANYAIVFEMPIILRSMKEITCTDPKETKSHVSFSILANPGYSFGPDIVSEASIIFDDNNAISTGPAITTCDLSPCAQTCACHCSKQSECTDCGGNDYCICVLLFLLIIITLIILILTISLVIKQRRRRNSTQ